MTQPSEAFVYSLPGVPAMTPYDFDRATRLIKSRTGIILGNHKEDMVARNLGLYTKKLNLQKVSEYLDHLDYNPSSPEWERFITIFTINHTAFYREQHHFEILANYVKDRQKPISIWSSACSTGEEPYSIAITLQETIPVPDSGVQVYATDIDTVAVERARQGVYTLDRVQPIPQPILKKYFYRGTGSFNGMARVKPNLQKMLEFDVVNLVSGEGWPHGRTFDAIFCRNVMIYFDKPTQAQILERFAKTLKPGGLLFVGHSENFSHMTTSFKLQGQTVYVRT